MKSGTNRISSLTKESLRQMNVLPPDAEKALEQVHIGSFNDDSPSPTFRPQIEEQDLVFSPVDEETHFYSSLIPSWLIGHSKGYVNPDLEEGRDLPKNYEPFPPELQGTPIEEIDENRKNHQSFVVISKRMGKHTIFRFSATKVCFMLNPLSSVRKGSLFIATNQWFDLVVILCISLNLMFLALETEIKEAEYVFQTVYTLEIIIRILARGFVINNYTYLRDTWNVLDFFVVIIGYAVMVSNQKHSNGTLAYNLSALRTFRVLRALKTISVMPGLRVIINALLRSLRWLCEVMCLMFFCLFFAALTGLQMFMGILRNKCVSLGSKNMTDWEYKMWIENMSNYLYGETFPVVCYNNTVLSLENYKSPNNCGHDGKFTCLNVGRNPNWGFTNYDTFWWSLLTSFQMVTLDHWEDVYDLVIRAGGYISLVYFLGMVFFGSFYLINLLLAVVTMAYEMESQSEADDECKQGDEDMDDFTYFKHKDIVEGKNETGRLIFLESTWCCKKNLSTGCSACCGEPTRNKWLFVQLYIYKWVSDPIFDLIVTVLIIVNTVFLSLDYYDEPKILTKILQIGNQIFATFFLIEAILKISAMGKLYFKSYWNMFDFTIVLVSTIELIISTLYQSASFEGLTILRVLRLLRVIKLARSWATMRVLLSIIGSTLSAVTNLTFILGMIIYIFAVIGNQMLGDGYVEDKWRELGENIPRWNFRDFFHSFMMVFRILCGEWIEALYECMRVKNHNLCIVIFLTTFIIGNFMVMNLFLAMLLHKFGQENLRKARLQQKNTKLRAGFKRLHSILTKSVLHAEPRLCEIITAVKDGQPEDNKILVALRKAKTNGQLQRILKQREELVTERINEQEKQRFSISKTRLFFLAKPTEAMKEAGLFNCFPRFCISKLPKCFRCSESVFYELWISFRLIIFKIVEHKYFEGFILIVIGISSYTLTLENIYLSNDLILQEFLKNIDKVFITIFLIEMIMKWIGMGFYKYFTNAWCILDFFIVLISLANIIVDQSFTAMRSLRTLRALRPLRAISRWQGMKIVVNALASAIPSIMNVFFVCIVFWLIFSIMGVQIMKGQFFACYHNSSGEIVQISCEKKPDMTKADCKGDYFWQNSKINFDNVLMGYLALFQVATFEGWMEVMESGIDSRGVDMQPCYENKLYLYFYFIAFIICGSLFTLNLFISVIIDTFNVLKKKYDGEDVTNILLTETQKNYYTSVKRLIKRKPSKVLRRPKNPILSFFFDVSISTKFEIAVAVMIIANMLTLSLHTIPIINSAKYKYALDMLQIIFTTMYVCEAFVRIVGLQQQYFLYLDNLLDFLIVALSVSDVIMTMLINQVAMEHLNPGIFRIFRLFRITRILRIVKSGKGIRKLIFALITSIPALFNIGMLLALIVFIYAIIGTSMFGDIKRTGALNELVNFSTFYNSVLLLFRLTTAGGWNDILDALMIDKDCSNDDEIIDVESPNQCGNKYFAIMYMSSFIFITNLIVINMYIAVILENFSDAHQQETLGVTDDDISDFYKVWQEYDPLATEYIPVEALPNLCAELFPPFQIPKPNNVKIAMMKIPINEAEKVHIVDLLKALVKNVLGDVQNSEEMEELMQKIDDKFVTIFPGFANHVMITNTFQRQREQHAARVIQKAWLVNRIRKELHKHQGNLSLKHKTSARSMSNHLKFKRL